jgi:hypothetical protein
MDSALRLMSPELPSDAAFSAFPVVSRVLT